jgi:hypothetical protein
MQIGSQLMMTWVDFFSNIGGLLGLGSILQNSISAETFSDNFLLK